MPYDEQMKADHQRLWRESDVDITDEDIVGATDQVVGAGLSRIGEELALKLRHNDGTETVHMINPVAAKNIGLLLLTACEKFGWFRIDLHIRDQSGS